MATPAGTRIGPIPPFIQSGWKSHATEVRAGLKGS